MNKIHFSIADCRLDPHWLVKSLFNHVCEQRALVDALDAITLRWNYGYSEEYFYFPDSDDPCPSLHFKGVAFGLSDKEVIIAEVEYWQYVRQVGLFWIEHNRTDKKNKSDFAAYPLLS